jgi:hypothetical protein
MLLTWVCRSCGDRLAGMAVREDDPRLAALTSQAGEDIIEYDRTGDLTIRILCEECLESLTEEQSEITFVRAPELH